MKHFVSAFAFLAVICCLTSAAPRPQLGLDSILGLIRGGGGGFPLNALLTGLQGPTGPSNVQSSGGDTTLAGLGNSVTKGIEANGNANIPFLNNVLDGGY